MTESYFAHISEDGRLHSLRDHLEGTVKLAAEFAGEAGGVVARYGGDGGFDL